MKLDKRQKQFDHAVVIGGSITGLTTARVLADTFARVTVVERDRLPETPQFRSSAPQARHAHSLPLRGQQIFEEFFPGLRNDLITHGAEAIDNSSQIGLYLAGHWHQLRHHNAIMALTFSRPLLENLLYRRLASHPQINFLQEREVIGLGVDTHRRRVTGVRLRRRQRFFSTEEMVKADLVVDASGRTSPAPRWLVDAGYSPPHESCVDAHTGYASRIYQRPANFSEPWKTLYIRPTPPSGTRGGMLLPIEGNRWYVSLVGMAGDYPPTGTNDFMDFARNLPTPHLFNAIAAAEPLTKAYGYRHTENRVRHFDRLPRFLEGFLVCGDAVYTLNPVYSQGMTAALLGCQALEHCLQKCAQTKTLTGLAQEFQTRLSQVVVDPWRMAVQGDRRWPTTTITNDALPKLRRVPAMQYHPAAA